MIVLDIFEKVNRVSQISQSDFLSFYNDTINEIINLYGENFTLGPNAQTEATSLNENVCIDDSYFDAIVDNIIYYNNVEDNGRKSEFLRKSKQAYNKIWKRHARNLKFKRRCKYV